jgi:hypothetical protein
MCKGAKMKDHFLLLYYIHYRVNLSKISLDKTLIIIFFRARKNLKQFGIIIKNGNPTFDSSFLYKVLKN